LSTTWPKIQLAQNLFIVEGYTTTKSFLETVIFGFQRRASPQFDLYVCVDHLFPEAVVVSVCKNRLKIKKGTSPVSPLLGPAPGGRVVITPTSRPHPTTRARAAQQPMSPRFGRHVFFPFPSSFSLCCFILLFVLFCASFLFFFFVHLFCFFFFFYYVAFHSSLFFTFLCFLLFTLFFSFMFHVDFFILVFIYIFILRLFFCVI
jgi:hypothetical protein